MSSRASTLLGNDAIDTGGGAAWLLYGHRWSIAIILLATFVAVLPAWKPIWYQADQLPSVFRTLHTDLAHHEGVFFPRMAFELGFGYGQLLHQVYAPLGFELTAWLHTFGLSYIATVRVFFSLCLILAAFGAYAYGLAVLRTQLGAALAASMYVWAPYLLLDVHPGGDFGESMGMALFPWTLLAFHALTARGTWACFAAAALALATIHLAHNITALFVTGLIFAYVILMSARAALRMGAGRHVPISHAASALSSFRSASPRCTGPLLSSRCRTDRIPTSEPGRSLWNGTCRKRPT